MTKEDNSNNQAIKPCPCEECILKVICINQEFMPLFNSCSIFSSYLLIGSNKVDIERLREYGKTMDVTIEYASNGVTLKYNRVNLSNYRTTYQV